MRLTIPELIKEIGVPSDSKFLGFVVHLPHSDEFLLKEDDSSFMTKRLWSKTPELAHIFIDQSESEKAAANYGKGAISCVIFDIVDQLFIASPNM